MSRTGRPKGTKNAHLKQPVIQRIKRLREVGLSHEAIARVIALDCGVELTAGKVRYYVGRAVPNLSIGTAGVSHQNVSSVGNLNRGD